MDQHALQRFETTPGSCLGRSRPVFTSAASLKQLAWLFLGVTLLSVWSCSTHSEIPSLWQYRGELISVTGEVTAVRETEPPSITIGDKATYRIAFQFTDKAGKRHESLVYATDWQPHVGETVSIEGTPWAGPTCADRKHPPPTGGRGGGNGATGAGAGGCDAGRCQPAPRPSPLPAATRRTADHRRSRTVLRPHE